MNRVKELCSKAVKSLRELSAQTGIAVSTLARLEAGGQTATLFRLAEYFKVDYSELREFEFVSPQKIQTPRSA